MNTADKLAAALRQYTQAGFGNSTHPVKQGAAYAAAIEALNEYDAERLRAKDELATCPRCHGRRWEPMSACVVCTQCDGKGVIAAHRACGGKR